MSRGVLAFGLVFFVLGFLLTLSIVASAHVSGYCGHSTAFSNYGNYKDVYVTSYNDSVRRVHYHYSQSYVRAPGGYWITSDTHKRACASYV